jgi:cyanate permease
MASILSNQVSTSTPVVAATQNGWLEFFAFCLTMGLVALFTWLLTGRYHRSTSPPLSLHPELEPAASAQTEVEEIELWRSRLEYLYLDVPAVDPRSPED